MNIPLLQRPLCRTLAMTPLLSKSSSCFVTRKFVIIYDFRFLYFVLQLALPHNMPRRQREGFYIYGTVLSYSQLLMGMGAKHHSTEDSTTPPPQRARVSIVQEPQWVPMGLSGLLRRTENLLTPPEFATQKSVAWQVLLLITYMSDY